MSLRARSWQQAHTFEHGQFPPALLAAERSRTVSVCLPARNEEATIGPIIAALRPLLDRGVIDQLVVVDDSTDATAGSPVSSAPTCTHSAS